MKMKITPSDWLRIAMFMNFIIDGSPYITVLFIVNEISSNVISQRLSITESWCSRV